MLDNSVVVLALTGVVLLVLNWWQNRGIAKQVAIKAQQAAYKAEEAVAAQNVELEAIHKLVNSRLSDALNTIEDLKALLLLVISAEVAADDPRVQAAIAKNS
jgi:cell division protein FtsB